MTKQIFAGTFALLAGFGIASQAHASDRIPFTTDILGRVQNVENGIDNVRVYLNHRLVVRRSTPVGSSTSVDGTVDTVIKGQELKDVVRRVSSGKIVGVETGSLTQIWVSFDSDCNARDCAWQFVNGFVGSHVFFLSALPTRDAQGLQVDAMWIGRKPFWWRTMETSPNEKWKNTVFDTLGRMAPPLMLQVKLNELMEVEHKTVRHDGWGN